MKILSYLHRNKEELQGGIKPIKTLNLKIYSYWSTEDTAKWDDTLPDIFVNGKPDRVEQTKAKFPKAIYSTSDQIVPTIENLIDNKNEN